MATVHKANERLSSQLGHILASRQEMYKAIWAQTQAMTNLEEIRAASRSGRRVHLFGGTTQSYP